MKIKVNMYDWPVDKNVMSILKDNGFEVEVREKKEKVSKICDEYKNMTCEGCPHNKDEVCELDNQYRTAYRHYCVDVKSVEELLNLLRLTDYVFDVFGFPSEMDDDDDKIVGAIYDIDDI